MLIFPTGFKGVFMVSQYTNWFILRFSQKIFRGVFPYDDQTTKGDYKKKLIKGGVVQHFICDQLLYLVNDVINHPRGQLQGTSYPWDLYLYM